MRDYDSIAITTFDDHKQTILDPILKKDIGIDTYSRLDRVVAEGKKSFINGFNTSKSILLKRDSNRKCHHYENRIIVLSDVCDSSIIREMY